MKKAILVTCAIFVSLITNAENPTIRYGRNVNIYQPVEGDIYLAAGSVNISAPVHGELIVAGGKVFINDTVTGNITILAGEVVLSGYAARNIRCAAGSLHIKGNVAGELAVTGGRILIDPSVSVQGIIGAGGSVVIRGYINGNLQGSFGELKLYGAVGNGADCRAEKMFIDGRINGDAALAAARIELGGHYYFGGNLRYWNKDEKLPVDPKRITGTSAFDYGLELDLPRWYYLGNATLLGLSWYLGIAFSFLFVIQWLFGKLLRKSTATAVIKPLTSVSYGLLVVLATPVAGVVLLCTVIGIPLGLMLLSMFALLMLCASIVISLLFANMYAVRYHKSWSLWKMCSVAFGIFILYKMTQAVPFLGWLVSVFLTLWAFGSLFISIRDYRRKQNNPLKQ